jgi:hypothetical protein
MRHVRNSTARMTPNSPDMRVYIEQKNLHMVGILYSQADIG